MWGDLMTTLEQMNYIEMKIQDMEMMLKDANSENVFIAVGFCLGSLKELRTLIKNKYN